MTAMPTAHTPGPWKLSEKNPDAVISSVGNYVADCGASMIIPPAEQAANARLIAAAPDLLSALDHLQSSPNDPRNHRRALNALAKARGGAA
jgi:hypothetical protein